MYRTNVSHSQQYYIYMRNFFHMWICFIWNSNLYRSWKRICLQCKKPGFNSWVGKLPCIREWQPTPVLPEESHEQKSPEGYSPWGHKESDTTEQLTLHFISWWSKFVVYLFFSGDSFCWTRPFLQTMLFESCFARKQSIYMIDFFSLHNKPL